MMEELARSARGAVRFCPKPLGPRCRNRLLAGFIVLAAGACATTRQRNDVYPERVFSASARAAWQALEVGEVVSAEAILRTAVTADPTDALSGLLLGLMAGERLRAREGLGLVLSALEAAAPTTGARMLEPWNDLISTAALVSLPPLLREASDAASETRLINFLPERLPWYGRLTLLHINRGIALWRGDAGRLAELARRFGCVSRMERLPRVGRLPISDLLSEPERAESAEQAAVPVLASGCRIELPARDGLSGVERLRAQVEVPPGEYDIVLERDGQAALRVDGGAWHLHGSIHRQVLGRSAVRVHLPAGRHTIELRIPSYGQLLTFVLAVMPVRPGEASLAYRLPGWLSEAERGAACFEPGGALARVCDLLAALFAEAHLDSEGYSSWAQRLERVAANGLALSTAARFALHDPSLPLTVARDRARGFYNRAVQFDLLAARSWLALATLALEEGRAREAERLAARAAELAPDSAPVHLVLYKALTSQGLERAADRTLDSARRVVEQVPESPVACEVYDLLAGRAEARARFEEEDDWLVRASACDGSSFRRASALERRRQRAAALAEYRRLTALNADRGWATLELADLLAAEGQLDEALELIDGYRARVPDDAFAWIRRADLLGVRDGPKALRDAIRQALERFPERGEVRHAARAVGLELPLDALRVDGKAVIDAFVTSGRSYAAPAVMVLDRVVERIFPTGARLVVNHGIVRVQTKEGIERWGEFQPAAGAEILRLRTLKADGRVLEPEHIAGKESISLPELAEGDFIEWEVLESTAPSRIFAPGFVGARFFFQSFELPLDRSEYWIVHPVDMRLDIDRRAGAPAPERDLWRAGLSRVRFSARHVPQRYAERAAVGAHEFLPSVRVAAQADFTAWVRFLDERLTGAARQSPELRAHARRLVANEADPAARIVAWVGEHIEEAEGEEEATATSTLARGRGSRLALALALARAAGLDARMVLARPLSVAASSDSASIFSFEDFAYPLFAVPARDAPAGQPWRGSWRHADLRLRHAPLGYLPPGLDGALAVEPTAASYDTLFTQMADARFVVAQIVFDATGQARAHVTEKLRGLPAFEWAETMRAAEHDEKKLRRDFERGWLAQHFPGAHLQSLKVQVGDMSTGEMEVRYGFLVPGMAQVDAEAGELVVVPRFFRADLGRRFASESERTAPLFLSFDVPLQLEARLFFPRGSTVIVAGESGVQSWTTPPGARGGTFSEERRIIASGAGGKENGPGVHLCRTIVVPPGRVSVADYAEIARKFRATEPLESAPIRVRLPGAPS